MEQIQREAPVDISPMPEEPEEDLDMSNHLMAKNSSILANRHASIKISDNRRPVYGVLTEPIRGRMRNKKDETQTYEHSSEEVSYIPRAHVQFLEQSGVVVVPIQF